MIWSLKQYLTKIVFDFSEYIVAFIGYYESAVREKYISEALTAGGIFSWKIIKRNNVAANFPSDFDVVQLWGTSHDIGINALNSHPIIKRVTPQRKVFRNLKYINETLPKGEFELPRFTGWSSLSLVKLEFLYYAFKFLM